MTARRLEQLTRVHRAAVDDFTSRARALDDETWFTPRAAGKWTPAQEARHLVLTYRAFIDDLRGERRLALKGTWWHRRIWRLFGLSVIKYAGRIPRAVRAPREVRPQAENTPRDALLLELASEVDSFERMFARVWSETPAHTVTHPFFGALSLEDSITVATVHTRHHARFLPRTVQV